MFHNNRFLSSTILCALLAVPFAGAAHAQTAPAAETKRPNAPDQKPAFEGQTRAPQAAAQPNIEKTVVAEGLPHLWSMEFLPDGRMIVAAKEGAMHIVADGKAGPAIAGVPRWHPPDRVVFSTSRWLPISRHRVKSSFPSPNHVMAATAPPSLRPN